MSRSIKDKVKYILENYEEARNSDKKCIELFIRDFHSDALYNGEWLAVSSLSELTSTETIRRTRQKIQEEARAKGLMQYLAHDDVYKVRQQMAENVAKGMKDDTWEYNLPA